MQVASATEARPGQLELRLPVDGAEVPFAYPNGDGCLTMEVALAGGGYASFVLASEEARRWAGEAFAPISVAYGEATGDPHALSEKELASLAQAERYSPRQGLHVCAEGQGPALLRFHLVVIVGECLDAGPLRARLVEEISERFNTARIGVDGGFVLAGRAS